MNDLDRRRFEDVSREEREELCRGVNWETVLAKLGFSFRQNTKGKLIRSCVFHKEKTPSLRFWPGSGYCCHGCRKRGADPAAFVHEVLGLREWSEAKVFFLGASPVLGMQLKLPYV